ncbi:proteasome accessory factor PafA2 family protein [Candidatus Saccharibacteria bacterium]|nr:proteasome accessory factor PafA2 family protein [Candidatus Saccharibacteria bacterium]
MNERIFGTETEFGLIIDGDNNFSSQELREALPLHTVMVREFLSNGARFYIDYNSQLEYATPECLGPADTVHAEIAGEKIVYETLSNLQTAGRISNFHLYKRVIDDGGETWGYHENYLIERDAFNSPRLLTLLLGHLATRNIFVGAGQWLPNNDNVSRVVPGQKTQSIKTDTSVSTTQDKPLLNLRDEPHASNKLWARLHITSGDANISPWATWLKLGSTSLVSRLVETGFARTEGIEFSDPAQVSNRVAKDDTLNNSYGLTNGRHAKAVNVQEYLLEQCEIMAEQIDVPKQERLVLKAWRKAHDDITIDPELLAGRADWITRRMLLSNFVLRHGIDTPDDQSLAQVDQTWDMVHPTAGIGVQRFRNLMPFPGYSSEKVERLQLSPPEGTRAQQRGNLIKNMPRIYRTDAEVNWELVGTAEAVHLLPNPYGNILSAASVR